MPDIEVTTDEPVTPPRRRRAWAHRVRNALLGVLALVLVAAGGGSGYLAWAVHRSFPVVEGSLRVPGLHRPVTVLRDRYGVPQIYADDPHDLFLAEGYTHAQDRFWQMDANRHVTAGRLSELFGASQVDTDRVIRTMGWRRVAQRELRLVKPTTLAYLRAYSAGVNAYLADHHGSALSVEYTLLAFQNGDYQPEPWTATDSDAWLKAMAWSLIANLDAEVQRGLLAAKLSPGQIADLYPPYDYSVHEPIVSDPDGRGGTGGGAGAPTISSAEVPALAAAGTAIRTLRSALGPQGTGIGSNSWVVAGSHTTTGRPLLANDPHLAPQQPGIWYQVGLHCRMVSASCPYDVTGFSFPGMPGVVIGHNADVAWGFTNFGGDVADLDLEKVSGSTFSYRGSWLPLMRRTETIKVAGGDPVRVTVRSTTHGPLLSDAMGEARKVGALGGYAVALAWTALSPTPTMDALFEIDAAHDWTSFRAAAADFAVPSQNLVYADTHGNIGYQAPGQIPVRRHGDGAYPQPAWNGDADWSGFIPFDQLPREYNPDRGFIVTANNAAVGPKYPHLLTTDWDQGYRSQRITDLIERAGTLDVADMHRIQSDTYNGNAATLVPYLLRAKATGRAAGARKLLSGWDFTQPPGSAAAAYFNAVWSHLLPLMFTDTLAGTAADDSPDGGDRWFAVVRRLLSTPDSHWWTNTGRRLSGRDAMLSAAMSDAADELTDRLGDDPTAWRWGDLHRLTLANQTLGIGGPWPVRKLLNRGPYDMGGGSAIVDANGWDAGVGYDVNWAPSMRLVADVGDFDRSRWVNQTGASGHAYDDHYDDQTPLWRSGRTTAWPFTRRAVARASQHRLTLRP